MTESTAWQEAAFKNFEPLGIDLEWFCPIPPDQFQLYFELKRKERNRGFFECLLKITGAAPIPAWNPGYAATRY